MAEGGSGPEGQLPSPQGTRLSALQGPQRLKAPFEVCLFACGTCLGLLFHFLPD